MAIPVKKQKNGHFFVTTSPKQYLEFLPAIRPYMAAISGHKYGNTGGKTFYTWTYIAIYDHMWQTVNLLSAYHWKHLIIMFLLDDVFLGVVLISQRLQEYNNIVAVLLPFFYGYGHRW